VGAEAAGDAEVRLPRLRLPAALAAQVRLAAVRPEAGQAALAAAEEPADPPGRRTSS